MKYFLWGLAAFVLLGVTSCVTMYVGAATSVATAPSYDGTFGESGDAIYFFTSTGQYVQWNDKYLYSDSPITLNKGAAALLAK